MSSQKVAKIWTYAKTFKGEVRQDNFELIQEELRDIENGEFLVEALFLSVDPYQRTFQLQFPIGSVILGRQVARYLK
jgi:prostaglandin reductase 1